MTQRTPAYTLGIYLGALVGYGLARLLLAWPVMLLVDPATRGYLTISYWQAVAVSLIVGFLLPGRLIPGGSKK